MFVGHYGVSFGAKSADRSIPLWVLFLAVQLLDKLWSALVLLRVEKGKPCTGRSRVKRSELLLLADSTV